jgi:hypothetical protein
VVTCLCVQMTRQQEWVGLSILLFTFDRILPPNVAGPKYGPSPFLIDTCVRKPFRIQLYIDSPPFFNLSVLSLDSPPPPPLPALLF